MRPARGVPRAWAREPLAVGALLVSALLALEACGGADRGRTAAEATDTVQVPVVIAAPEPLEASPEAPLEATEWRLFALPGAPDPPPGARATLVLEHEGGFVRGSTGCNDFDGSWEIAGTRLTLGLGEIGRASCAPELARLETDYLEALRGAGSYRLRGDTLDLLGARGVVARFTAP